MKKLVLLSLLPFGVFAQQPFQITGHAGNIKDGTTIYLSYSVDRKPLLDSSKVTYGLFSFAGQLSEPSKATFFYKPGEKGAKRDVLSFYVEPADFKLKVDDSLKRAIITGSKINSEDAELKLAGKDIQAQLDKLSATYDSLTEKEKKDPKTSDAFYKKYSETAAKLVPIQLEFAKSHPDSYVSINALVPLASNERYIDEAQRIFLALSPKVRQTQAGKNAEGVFIAGQKTKIGSPAIAFTQNDANGKPISLESFKGKYVLIDFWASWCGPCRKENPNVVAAFQRFKDKGFTVLGVSLDKPDAREAWIKAVADDKLDWTQVSDLKFWDNEVAKAYGVRSIPANFLIDPTGKIVAKGLRGEALATKLEELLSNKSRTK